jgi:two-component system OmpR family sensor kinase
MVQLGRPGRTVLARWIPSGHHCFEAPDLGVIQGAFHYAPELSTVRLAVRQEDSDWVFEVSDEGPGIAPDQRERIFERFARADSARTRSGGGAGLGLALSAAIATAQGGSLELVDRPAPGATFRLRLRAGSA